MSNKLDELLSRVTDPDLREALQDGIDELNGNRPFGLVFEKHLPESVRLPGTRVTRGACAVRRSEAGNTNLLRVLTTRRGIATCRPDDEPGAETQDIPVEDLVVVARFGDPVFPGLEHVSSAAGPEPADGQPVDGGGDAHLVIEGENFHTLQALRYTHAGKVDLIYVDPPYNTGSNDWIYNDRYIGKQDAFRHSKWLSFMERRLELAHELLSQTGIVVLSIGPDEVHRLAQLCEQIFRGRDINTVTVQTSGGKPSGGFNLVQEYLIFVAPEDFSPGRMSFTGGKIRSPHEGLTLSTFLKTNRGNQAYPIFIDTKTGCIAGVGQSLRQRLDSGDYRGQAEDFPYDFSEAPEGTVALWPITAKRDECVWRLEPQRLMSDWSKGYIKVSPNARKDHPNRYSVQYLPAGVIKKVESGALQTVGTAEGQPTLEFGENTTTGADIPTIWLEKQFRTTSGTSHIKDVLGDGRFPYPKPMGLLEDVIRGTSQASKDATILDFFAGSGSTGEAVLRLNAEDGGTRKFILVTNNELAAKEDKRLRKQGLEPGRPEYEKFGVFQHVTWPRLKTVLTGVRKDGSSYSDGLPGRIEAFRLTYQNPDQVTDHLAFGTVAPLLWMMSGTAGTPMIEVPTQGWAVADSHIVITNVSRAEEALHEIPESVTTVFTVTDSDSEFATVNHRVPETLRHIRLYSHYLSQFAVNTGN